MASENVAPDQEASGFLMGSGAVRVLKAVAAALGVVILAPIALSSQDLYAWAAAPRGLNLAFPWPLLVPVALDLAAAACIGMTIVAAWRRDRPGVFGILVWVFALTSAYAQYTHGIAERDAGRAQDAWWAMPAFALLGPLLLDVTLHRLRKWLRQDAEEILTGAAGFGVRWLVAPWSTLSAWAVSRREGIATAPAALRFVADRKTLKHLTGVEAVHYAFGATATTDSHTARVWLAARGVRATQSAIDTAATATADHQCGTTVAGTPEAPTTVVVADEPPPTKATAAKRATAAERVGRQVARTPNATNAVIAARAGLSESTVRRYRRPADATVTPELDRDERPADDFADLPDDASDLDLAHV